MFSLIEGRIEDAHWHLRKFVRMQNSTKPSEKKSSSEGADGVHVLSYTKPEN